MIEEDLVSTTTTTPPRVADDSAPLPDDEYDAPVEDEHDAPLEEGPPPTWDTGSQRTAEDAAAETMRLYARPDVSPGEWWRDLAPRLTPAARFVYQDVPANRVPITEVRSAAVVEGEVESPYLAHVEVETDNGTYLVLLVRESGTSPWLVEWLKPVVPS